MGYHLGNGIWAGVFAVPNEIVDRHIRLCSPLSLKVLLVLLRSGGDLELEDLARVLGQAPADVQDALHYWIGNGVIGQEELGAKREPAAPSQEPAFRETGEADAASFGAKSFLGSPALTYTVVEDAAEPAREERKVVTLSGSRRRLTTQMINELVEQDRSIANLLQETQQVMGKPLTPVMTDTVAALYSYYGMKPDLVLMLLQYCVSIGKDSARYIEKVAASWLEQGIDSHEKAEAEIKRATQKDKAEHQIKAAFGIYDRTLVAAEKKYIQTWTEEYAMDLSLIKLAFERSVELKGKLSFAYINGILSNWKQKNVRTVADAMVEINRGREQRQSAQRGGKSASYDMDELEQLISGDDFHYSESKN